MHVRREARRRPLYGAHVHIRWDDHYGADCAHRGLSIFCARFGGAVLVHASAVLFLVHASAVLFLVHASAFVLSSAHFCGAQGR